MSDFVSLNTRDYLVEIVLNRTEKRNAINWPMMLELEAAIDEAAKVPVARAILIRAEGSGFSAGIDLMGFTDMIEIYGENWRDNLFPVTAGYQGIVNKFERCGLPTIALLHGYCLGLGFELALACDFRIVAQGTKIGLPETRLGLIPDVGGTTRLTRLVGASRAKELIMTGRNIDLDCAERWGIVNAVVPSDELLAKGEALAAELAQAAPLAVSYAKRVIDGISDIERGLQLEAWAQSHLMRTRDFEIGAQAMLTKQVPEWTGK
jgi:enoyl-CoA hydratase/carnithine racemase